MIEVTPTCDACADLPGGVYDDGDDYEQTGIAAGMAALHARTHPGHVVSFLVETVEDGDIWRLVEAERERTRTATLIESTKEDLAARHARERQRAARLRQSAQQHPQRLRRYR